MGDPVQKNTAKVVFHHPVAVKKQISPKCDKGEYLDINQRGEFVCLLDPGPLKLMGDGMTCGEGGGFPCDIGRENFGIVPKGIPSAPPPKDQFTPGSSTENQVLTRIAEFQCTQTHYTKIFRPYGVEGESEIPSGSEQLSRKTPVTIKVVPNESAAETEDRFEQAVEIELRGMLFRKEMSDCDNHRFARFLPTAQEILGVKAKGLEADKSVVKVVDKCDGEWASRSVCSK